MKKITIISEGDTESRFALGILQPFFLSMDIVISSPQILQRLRSSDQSLKGGIVSIQQLIDNIKKHLNDSSATVVTTLVDYYEFPFEEPRIHNDIGKIERQLADKIQDSRFIPYLQKHEFEALLFSDTSEIERVLALKEKSLTKFSVLAPEEINSTPSNHPSQILKNICKNQLNRRYSKPIDGLEIASRLGLPKIRAKCPRFSAWIEALVSKCTI